MSECIHCGGTGSSPIPAHPALKWTPDRWLTADGYGSGMNAGGAPKDPVALAALPVEIKKLAGAFTVLPLGDPGIPAAWERFRSACPPGVDLSESRTVLAVWWLGGPCGSGRSVDATIAKAKGGAS